jgi:hypothetical protein
MKQQHHFERANDAKSKEAAQISKMIGDLGRLIQILDCEIATDEERAGVSDRSDPTYPILARTLAVRRNNLRDTITALEQRLSGLPTEIVPELA